MKKSQLVPFFTHIADMISVGIPLKNAVSAFRGKDPTLVKTIVRGLDRGLSFTEALKKTGKFPVYVYSTVMAGEKGGALEKSLRNIIDYTEEEIKFSGQLKKTLFMPGINLLMIVFVVFFMATVTLPKLEVTLSSLGNGNLPEFSKTVFHISHIIKDNLKTIIVVSISVIGLLVWWIRTQPPFILSVPIVGTMLRYKFIVSLFNRIVLIHKAGGSLHEALNIVQETEKGTYRKILRTGIKKVERGKQLQDIFDDPLFPRELKQMVATASESGKIDQTFERIAQIYSRQLYVLSDKFAMVIEPASVILVGFVVGTVMMSVLYPIFSASDVVGPH